MGDRVSILIPCYNAGPFVREAVESALLQDYPNKEIIVVDDGSTDNSLEVLKTFGNKIELHTRPNQGGNFTRNELLNRATGKWIQYLDADDYFVQGKISEQMAWMNAHPEYDIVYAGITLVYDNGKEKREEPQSVPFPDDPWSALVSWQLPQTGSPIFRKTSLDRIGGWNVAQKVCQEHELYFRLLKDGARFIGVPGLRNVAQYRIWSNDTVSRRKPYNTFVARMAIMEQAYGFMKEKGMTNEFRDRVFLEWCLLVARGFWELDKAQASAFFNRYANIYPLSKIRSRFLRPMYLRLVQWLGFNSAQRIASVIR